MDISEISLVDIATYGSFLYGILFFLYQEVSGKKVKNKEAIRLKEEFINLIIRNHVNSDIKITDIDFDTMISGFEKTKN